MKKNRISVRRIAIAMVVMFAAMNLVAFFHAYKFTHFTDTQAAKTKDPSKLSVGDKITALLFGVNNPRPQNRITPSRRYETISFRSDKQLEGWLIGTDNARGTVILFHGYSGAKSLMLDKADEFIKLGYNAFLVDFRGSGGSEGSQTTIGNHEAADVKASMEYVQKNGEKNIYLFGTSMGAVAVMKAIHDYSLAPKGIIVECPFGTMYQTTCARFDNMHVPSFPMAGLLVFWGGVQNSFWAFGHNPTEYAKQIQCPTLLLYGEKDKTVSRAEIDEMYSHLKGPKTLKIYPLAGHENYLRQYKQQWIGDVHSFLTKE